LGSAESTPGAISPLFEREKRLMRPAGIAALGAIALVIGSLLLVSSIDSVDTDAGRLLQFHDHSGKLILASVVRGAGFGLLALPLAFLFQAAAARSERVATRLLWLILVAPGFLALSTVLSALALDEVASQFIQQRANTKDAEQLAEDLAKDSGLLQLASGLGLAGTFGLAAGVFYTSLWSMRTGLISRFLGTFGMAVAVVFVAIQFGVLIWFIGLGFLLSRLRPPPPAWDAGIAVPWPKPGEQVGAPDAEQPRDVVEGHAEEVQAAPAENPGEPDQLSHPSSKKRKRKRRG
jgi:MFS family permease